MSVWFPGPWGQGIIGGALTPDEFAARAASQGEEVVMPESPHQAAIDEPKRTRRPKSDG